MSLSRPMPPRRLALAICGIVFGCALPAMGHDVITTKITWNREILRIIYSRCASCHRPGGSAFSLMKYEEGRPWAKAIQEETLERRMPPWGAVKGFGDYRDDQALTPEQLELIAEWVDGGAPEGEERDLPPPQNFDTAPASTHFPDAIAVSGDFKLQNDLMLGGLLPQKVPDNTSLQITAELPDGSVVPLLWLFPFKPAYGHPFFFRNVVELPGGTMIRGVPADSSVLLFPASQDVTKSAPSDTAVLAK
jgi:hypothetical protein